MKQNPDPLRHDRSLHTREWTQAALASVYWHTHRDAPPPQGFEAFPLERALRLLAPATGVDKLLAASMVLRAGQSWDQVRALVESTRPAHAVPLTPPEVERVQHILTTDDLRVPPKPDEHWATEVVRSSAALKSLGLSGGLEYLTLSTAVTTSAAARSGPGCFNASFSFVTLRPISDLRHILDPQRWDDCSDLFIQTHVLATPPPPSGTTWGLPLDVYEQAGLVYPGPCGVPFTFSISNLLDADFQVSASTVRTDFSLSDSYEDVLDVDEGFFEAATVGLGPLSLRIVTGAKCVHFTCATLDDLAHSFFGILLPLAAIQMVSTCTP